MAGLLGLATIYLSSEYISRFPWGTVVLPWRFPPVAIAAFVATGLCIMYCAWQRPSLFWPLLIVTAIVVGGARVLRFPIFDEWLAAWIAAGGILAVRDGRVLRRQGVHQSGWLLLFLVFAAHFTLLAVVGLVGYENPKAARFVLVGVVVGVIAFLLARYEFPRPSPKGVSNLVAASGLAYFLLYIGHGYLFKDYVFRYNMEGIGAAGAGYAMFPLIVTIPASILLIGKGRGWERALGWACFAAGLAATILGDARGGQAAYILGVLAAPFCLGWYSSMKVFTGLAVVALVMGVYVIGDPNWVENNLEHLGESAQIQRGSETTEYYGQDITHGKGDAGRQLLIIAAIDSWTTNDPITSIVGSGAYGFFPAAGDNLDRLHKAEGTSDAVINSATSLSDSGASEAPRPPALGAIMVESGILGTVMLLLLLFLAASSIAMRKHRGRLRLIARPVLVVGISIPLLVFWMYFAETQDVALAYFMLMPHGLIHTWGAGGARERVRERRARMVASPEPSVP